ncbi:MAG: Asp-tRNA(Asn)/Glu-tRNA(Gln) amidotransferase subunit GatB [Chloroflexi bacterium]|nr:MAG: glutamyl-tRNA(Gln) amidotransferase subunit B [Chloroflexi bacterium OLB13]MBV6436192.1 Aspartyl/glutamyl-tRNA(Asn/Gln) amidotransferase subunit B [Anaerolineae bacterium]MCC6564285.1 Asp-tRNA(Asn)/Glu-tRNA(Gln) amidotransferase subunit GatB [Chloroflexota bacterium]MBW7880539.1 Asp-tRNA(Asn)/Glu-tRNA(Gln) amidotransferase subunit GatB [Anaerolineae bacterium]MCO6443801.1 Asp-tRNA(Asn)/Glu-tRNA(Gln) amidotransferase subunit GatB [Anaerolineae bacterium]
MSDWKTIIGLEVHAELLTESKMFSPCPVVDSVEAAPNTAVDPLSLGLPGTLPVVNMQAVEYAMMVGLALNCEIPPVNQFARKSYFYPDLPKGFQISQYDRPLAVNGYIDIALDGETKRIRVRRAHLEEDTGKLTHEGDGSSLVDYNRAGVPLLEIVSEPDIFSSAEAEAYSRKLRALLQYLGVNHGDMSKGVLRFEANVSVMHKDDTAFRTRREIKNLNSIRSMVRAIDAEVAWQIRQYESGGAVTPATLGWDEAGGKIVVQRYKERADEYRYFPEPDIPVIEVSRDWVEEVRAHLPELPDAKVVRYTADYGVTDYEARRLVEDRAIADFFEAMLAEGAPAKQAVNWMLGGLFRTMNEANVGYDEIGRIRITPAMLAELIALVQAGTINNTTANTLLSHMWESGQMPSALVKQLGLEQVSDTGVLRETIETVLNANPDMVAGYLAGKDKLIKALMGQCMAALKGKGNPQAVTDLLAEALEARRQ